MKVPPGDAKAQHASVTAAEIIRNFGHWQQQALEAPLAITHHGRARVMLISTETYQSLRAAAVGPEALVDDAQMLIDSMMEGFLLHDRSLHLIAVNAVAEAYFGRRRSDIIGTRVADPFWAPGNAVVQSMLNRVLKSGESVSYETDSKLFPGRRISVRSFPYGDGVASLFMNITEQERASRGAENMQALTSALAGLKRVSVIKLDLRARLISGDDMLTAITGFTVKDLSETRLINCIVPADRRLVQSAYDEMVAQSKSGVVSLRIITKSGEERRIKMALVPVMREFIATGVMVMMIAET